MEITHAFQTIINDIVQHADGRKSTVYILGRYHRNKPRFFDAIAGFGSQRGIAFEFSTAHSAKGEERDYVIVVGLEAGEYGFPASVADDPVMDLVLAEEEPFSYAEERRLFYVAMTRAKRRVYLVAPQDNASTFVQDDLLTKRYRQWVEHVGEISARHTCPKCQGITIRRIEGQYSTFWACTHFPLCDGKLETCTMCRSGGIVMDAKERMGRCTDCGHAFERCPRCDKGYLRERNGRYGLFLACSQWNNGTGCTFTRNVPQRANA